MAAKRKKLIVIGIDGGNFEVINSLISKGLMPNLTKLKFSGVLSSTIPPGTAVAWASFSTGNYPGKTGIYDFTLVNEDSWKINFINRKKLKGKTLWEMLSENKIKSCFINIPLTYPPDKINGVIISGIDTPSTLNNYTYPPELKEKLKEFDYEIEVGGLKEKSDMVKKCVELVDKRTKVANYLLEKDFDFFAILFRESDVAQHFAWGGEEVEEIYKKIDQFIGKVIEEEKNSDVIIISDHGEEEVKKAFNINSWLEKEGYLKTTLKKKSLFSIFGINRERIYRILNYLNLDFLVKMVPRSFAKKIPTKDIDFEEAILTKIVDLEKTRAIGKRAVKTAQIFLNTEERGGMVKKEEKDSLKKEIKEKLENFFAKNKIKALVQTKEELYGGAINAPDITLYLEERGYDILTYFTGRDIWGIPREEATHDTEGIIFSNLSLQLKSARIVDLAPTILRYFGIKEKNFDGKSLL